MNPHCLVGSSLNYCRRADLVTKEWNICEDSIIEHMTKDAEFELVSFTLLNVYFYQCFALLFLLQRIIV